MQQQLQFDGADYVKERDYQRLANNHFKLKESKLITRAAINDNNITVANTISIRVNPLDLPVIMLWLFF